MVVGSHNIKWAFVMEGTGSKYSRWVGEYPPDVIYLIILTWNSPTVRSTANSCSSAPPWQPSQTLPVFYQQEKYLEGGNHTNFYKPKTT